MLIPSAVKVLIWILKWNKYLYFDCINYFDEAWSEQYQTPYKIHLILWAVVLRDTLYKLWHVVCDEFVSIVVFL